MTILITGATGSLGKVIVDRLIKEFGKSNPHLNEKLILLGHSEKRADSLRVLHGIPVFVGDIQSKTIETLHAFGPVFFFVPS